MGRVVFPGWDGKFLISWVEEGNQRRGKFLASPYKYHTEYGSSLYMKTIGSRSRS